MASILVSILPVSCAHLGVGVAHSLAFCNGPAGSQPCDWPLCVIPLLIVD